MEEKSPANIIELKNVSKEFHFAEEKPQSLLEAFIAVFASSRKRMELQRNVSAVKNVNLSVQPGRCLGIIGRNGSGKSTLLKLIARILRPNSGRIMVQGRVSALLELGAGFHPDLTGRENIYLNASVLGLGKAEIDKHFQSVVDFSELAKFIDMPVKYYSSGMYMRLGFSVAIHVKPDILIVDEILAVGDQAFQEKCLDHIYGLKNRGVTIVLVSHSQDTVRKLCTDLIWLEQGEVYASGEADEVMQQYLQFLYGSQSDAGSGVAINSDPDRWGTGELEITRVRILNGEGEEKGSFFTGDPMTIEMSYTAHRPIKEPEFGLAIFRADGIHVNGPNNQLAGMQMGTISGDGVVRYHIDRLPLLPAKYELTAAVHDSQSGTAYDYHKQAYKFRVVPGRNKESDGLFEIPATWIWEDEKVPANSLSR